MESRPKFTATSVPTASPNLDRLFTTTRIPGPLKGDEIILWDLATGEELERRTLLEPYGIHFSRDGQLLIETSDHAGANLKETMARPHDPTVSENGRWVLVWIPNGAVVRDTVTGRQIGELRNPGDEEPEMFMVSGSPPWAPWTKGFFSPDSKTVVITGLGRNRKTSPMYEWLSDLGIWKHASFGYDGVARLWDVERCKELACFEDCDRVLYSPDSKTLATAHKDGTVRLWDVPPRKPMLAILGTSLVLWFALLLSIQLGQRFLRRFRR